MLLIGSGLALYARHQRGLERELTATEASCCGDITELANSVAQDTEPGLFSERVEVSGTARPGGQGLLQSPFSAQTCLWYQARITHRYWEWETDSEGNRSRREQSRVLSDEASEAPFFILDDSGQVSVEPKEASMDSMEQSFDRFESDKSSGSAVSFGGFNIDLGSGGSIGFKKEEWIIRDGTRLYVLGELNDQYGSLAIRKGSGNMKEKVAGKGKLIISTRSEQEMLGSIKTRMLIAASGAGVLVTGGIVLLIAGLTA
jgi:hypothetical protein